MSDADKMFEEDRRYVLKVLNDMKIEDEDKFMSAVANVIYQQNKLIKRNEEIILAMKQRSNMDKSTY